MRLSDDRAGLTRLRRCQFGVNLSTPDLYFGKPSTRFPEGFWLAALDDFRNWLIREAA